MSRPKLALSALPGSVVLVAAMAALPRRAMVNDDSTIAAFLRMDTLAPYVHPALSQTLGAAYRSAPNVPWFGLWQYALYAASLAALAVVLALSSRGRRDAGIAVLLFSCVAAQVFRPTFTTAGLTACGVGLIAMTVAASRRDAALWLVAGLLVGAGCATRAPALGAAALATGPLLLQAAWRTARSGAVPWSAVAGFVAPTAALLLLGPLLPQAQAPEARHFLAINAEVSAMQACAPFLDLPRRAPDLLRAAGWDARHFRRFEEFTGIDEGWYTVERLRALRETGGRPYPLDLPKALRQTWLAGGHGSRLLALVLVLALVLAAAGARLGPALVLAHAVAVLAAGIVLLRFQRFPARVAVPMTLLAACAAWLSLRADATDDASRPAPKLASLLVLLGALAWLLPALADRVPTAGRTAECAAFERRLQARGPALVVVHAQAACWRDPLRAEPRPYPYLSLDWDNFSVPFYAGLKRLGIARGADLATRLVDDPNVYLLAERRFLPAVAGMVSEDAPGARLLEIDTAGEGPDAPVLLRVSSAR